VLRDKHENHHDYDPRKEHPEHMAQPVTAQARQLALPDRYQTVRHVNLAGVPSENGGNGQRNYDHSYHGSPGAL
jgi:hypothetical protein